MNVDSSSRLVQFLQSRSIHVIIIEFHSPLIYLLYAKVELISDILREKLPLRVSCKKK
jgi:hypothetical protein